MSSGDSVTQLIHAMQAGSAVAVQDLWERYFPQLVQFARRRLQGHARLVDDEEDVALSAMNRFFRAAQQGRYPSLAGRDDLWRLLLQITNRRLLNLWRDAARQRRGGSRDEDRSAGPSFHPDADASLEMHLARNIPTPEFAATMADECRRLLEVLEDAELQAIAVAKMEGYTNAEIAARLNRSERTIERRLRLIRDRWRWERRNSDQAS